MLETVRVRHDAEIEITVTPRYGPLPGTTEVTTADLLDAALLRLSYMYVGVSGNNHGSAKASWRLLNPDRDILIGDDECTCERC